MDFDGTIVNGRTLEPIDPPKDGKNFFIDRRKNSKALLMILAGYKTFLYEDIFARVRAFTPKVFDICITSSGMFDETLSKIAAENDWSYLSMAKNNIPLAQNTAIELHEKAEYLFKMDEDIFITEGVFDTLLKTYEYVKKYGHYNIGFVAPLIPINGCCHVRLLEKLGLLETYEKMFEPVLYGAQYHRMIEKSPEVAKFFWGEGGIVPSLDRMNDAFRIQKTEYSICSMRFSIGLIFFHRNLWNSMGKWRVSNGIGLGADEVQICTYCVAASLAMVVAENAVVGHLSFGQQNEAMKEYYLTHREVFRCPK